MTDGSTILLHENAKIGEFKREATQALIAQLIAQAGGVAQIIERIGLYEKHDSGCSSFEVVLIKLFQDADGGDLKQVIDAMKALKWIINKSTQGDEILEFSRLS